MERKDPNYFLNNRFLGTVLCISLSCIWLYLRRRRRKLRKSNPNKEMKDVSSVRFASTSQRSASFWRRATTEDQQQNRTVRFYSDPDADRLDHEADVALLEQTKRLGKVASSGYTLEYSTWVPPPSWNETRRRNFMSRIKKNGLGRTLVLNLHTGLSVEKEEGGGFTVDECWVCPSAQVQTGVLQLYATDDDSSTCTEHSFRSARSAAQFQLDLISFQTLGQHIYNIFRVLCLVHQGSEACDFAEPVLHDTCPTEATTSFVAWDDVMRCLGMYFPSIRFRLEALHVLHDRRVEDTYLTEPYQSKRLILSLVDFFRLFVPQLPATALPERDCSRSRMERLLKTRKRLAKAAVLVQGYVQARTVVNRGWPADDACPDFAWKRRLAYDTNWDNEQHDGAKRHEYYEGTVSRDVECGGGYQGYTLVGLHSFHSDNRVQDPVMAFPSIYNLVKRHPEMHFWVQSFYLETRRVVCVQVFVRSLATSVDKRFDKAMSRFAQGDGAYRSSVLGLHVQLGLALDGLSMFGSCLLMFFTLCLRLTLQKVPLSNVPGRTGLPSMRLAGVSDTWHYGGKMSANDPAVPSNYLACASLWGPSQAAKSLLAKILLSYLEFGIFSMIVADLTMVLTEQHGGARVGRSLCTVRIVRESTVPLVESLHKEEPAAQQPARVVWKLLVEEPMKRLLKRIRVSDEQALLLLSSEECSAPRALASSHLLHSTSGDRRHDGEFLAKIPLTQSIFVEQAVTKIVEILHDLETRGYPGVGEDAFKDFFKAFGRHDVFRFYVAEHCNMRRALFRIIASAKWRKRTFPIDTRSCRIELQNGQFFQHGFDRLGHPIFYFRSALLGPWRKNESATIAAVLHTFEQTMTQLSRFRPFVRCILIIIMGRSASGNTIVVDKTKEDEEEGDVCEQGTFDSTVSDPFLRKLMDKTIASDLSGKNYQLSTEEVSNPRVHPDEIYQNHTSQALVTKLINLIITHYPERLHRAFVIVGHNNGYLRSKLGGSLSLSSLISSPATREKIRFHSKLNELSRYFDLSEARNFGDTVEDDHKKEDDGNNAEKVNAEHGEIFI